MAILSQTPQHWDYGLFLCSELLQDALHGKVIVLEAALFAGRAGFSSGNPTGLSDWRNSPTLLCHLAREAECLLPSCTEPLSKGLQFREVP